ncbi:MAG: cation:proton antiporter [Gammaproteobacteria bacterium]
MACRHTGESGIVLVLQKKNYNNMGILNTLALLVSLTALFSYLNVRYLRLPTTLATLLIALLLSLGLLLLAKLGWPVLQLEAQDFLRSVTFHQDLVHGLLGFLLFAGALHINLSDLSKHRAVIMLLAMVGVLISTLMVAGFSYWILNSLGLRIAFLYCLLFGALISATDPLAVLSILKGTGINKLLQDKVAGESLFGGAVGVVVFLVLLSLLKGGVSATPAGIAALLLQKAAGGALLGLLGGFSLCWLLRTVNHYQVEVLLTVALVMGGYALATLLQTSGLITVVVAGLVLGSQGRGLALPATSREHLVQFWGLLGEVLMVLLLVLIGLEMGALNLRVEYALAALAIIPMVLLARFGGIAIPLAALRRYRRFGPNVVEVLTWGGLRGGVAIALALSLPLGVERDVLLAVTYAVVVSSILVQGLTLKYVVAGN